MLGMVLKGYPRISENFISTEILLLEKMGIPIEIYSLRQPRESFTHANVKEIRAPVTYMPEYVLPHWPVLARSNGRLAAILGRRYWKCAAGALQRAWQRRTTATLRHFFQAAHLTLLRLRGRSVCHLHAHFCHTPTSVVLFAHQLSSIPFSFTAHAKDIYTSDPRQLRRKIEAARFVVTCTRYNARYLKGLSDAQTPIHTIYHGIDLDFFQFRKVPEPRPPYRILSVGRLVAKKGYDDLLLALRILKDGNLDFRFDHIGSGELEDDIRARCVSLGLQDRVRFLGTLPHQRVIDHYRDAHCFVLACKVAANGDRDGIPNVLVEAMAVGLPVISTYTSAIPELVEHGRTGTLVRPADPAGLARAIADVLLRPHPYRSMLEAARATVEGSFDNRRCTAQLYELFRRVIAGEAGKPGE